MLLGGATALMTLALSRPSHAEAARRIVLRHSGSGARFDGIWHDGTAPDPVAMRELSEVLADPGANPWRPFDPATIDFVWQVAMQTRLGSELDIHSGFRTPRINRAVHGAGDSQHLRASALDVGVPSGRLASVADAALKLGRGGVGIYRRRGFVHLDSGTVRSWSDGGGSGGPGNAFGGDRVARVAEAWRLGR
jgi:uncharacterized protein YcbK (DUF882 family)